jgi:membrane protein DedA with SNARE-associated domain
VLVVAWLATILGNVVGYLIGRRGGRKLVSRFGNRERAMRLERTFERYGAGLLVVSRFIDGLRQTASVLAGTLDMPWRRFLAATTIGTTIWVAVWGLGAYILDKDFYLIERFFHGIKPWAWVLSAVLVLILLGVLFWRRQGS